MTKAEAAPKPVLGRSQFEVVAGGFKSFDEYLVRALGEMEGDIAKREGLRDDTFMIAGVQPPETLQAPPVAMSQRHA